MSAAPLVTLSLDTILRRYASTLRFFSGFNTCEDAVFSTTVSGDGSSSLKHDPTVSSDIPRLMHSSRTPSSHAVNSL